MGSGWLHRSGRLHVKAIGTEENIEYSKEKNEDYYPLEGEDIAGRLHELYYSKLD